ncbi:AraC family transcriptional regulator [Brumicola pallidula]|nr:AraC family transcriptional regulator [Glaciecola pallidula]
MTDNISLPTYYFGHVISVLKQSGIGIEKWLASQRLDLAKLLEADARVSVQQFDGLIKTVIGTRGFEDLGLSVGKRLEIAHHGDFGLAILNSATLRQVLDFHVKFLPIRVPLIKLNYDIDGSQVLVTLTDEHWQGSLHRAVIEAVMIAIVNMLHVIKFQDNSQLLIDVVKFDYAKPNYEQKYQYIKAAKLEFDKPNCSLLFSKQFIDKPLASADDFSFQRAVLNCQKELDSYLHQNLSTRYRVIRLLKQDDGIGLSLDDIAQQLHISKRSLHRSLEREGTSFKLLLQKIKIDRAVTLLQHGKTVTEVADLLNYSDCANFTRAFKTWFGVAPKEWIARNRVTNATK